MKLGFIKPNFPNEKRIAILPEHIQGSENEFVIESSFGKYMDISDNEYKSVGCKILSRRKIFKTCDVIFSLKLIQPSDYDFIRDNQMIIGWTHPTGSGAEFMVKQAIPKNLIIVDLDNTHPSLYYKKEKIRIDWIPANFIWKNSFYAGYAATMHALLFQGIIITSNTRVAILAPGNVSQGAFYLISKLGADVRLYYRKTLKYFKKEISNYDVIINGIEVDQPDNHIITYEDQKNLKDNCLLIDAAADAGNAIEGTIYTTIDNPIYKKDNVYYYVVNNAPSIFYRETSKYISESFSQYIYNKDVSVFYKLMNNNF